MSLVLFIYKKLQFYLLKNLTCCMGNIHYKNMQKCITCKNNIIIAIRVYSIGKEQTTVRIN